MFAITEDIVRITPSLIGKAVMCSAVPDGFKSMVADSIFVNRYVLLPTFVVNIPPERNVVDSPAVTPSVTFTVAVGAVCDLAT